MTASKTLRICPEGHRYYKSSDCPVCPECEKENLPNGFMKKLSAPARRALENAGITTLNKLEQYSEAEILKLHGIGKSSMPKLKKLMKENGMDFKK